MEALVPLLVCGGVARVLLVLTVFIGHGREDATDGGVSTRRCGGRRSADDFSRGPR